MREIYCNLCLRLYGRIDLAPFQSEDAFAEHCEKVHHVMVAREGESNNDARARFLAENPDVTDIHKCDCARCESKRRYGAQLKASANN